MKYLQNAMKQGMPIKHTQAYGIFKVDRVKKSWGRGMKGIEILKYPQINSNLLSSRFLKYFCIAFFFYQLSER